MPTKLADAVAVEDLPAHLEELNARLALSSLAEPLEECGQVIRGAFEENIFNTEGPDGNPWPPHAPSTVARYGPHPLLILSGRMLESLTRKDAQGNVTIVEDREAEFGTDVTSQDGFFYPGIHDAGGSRIPQREFIYASPDREEKCGEILSDWIEKNLF